MLKLQSAVTRDLPARCPHCQAWLVHERTCSEAGVVRDLQRFDSAFLSVTESSPSTATAQDVNLVGPYPG